MHDRHLGQRIGHDQRNGGTDQIADDHRGAGLADGAFVSELTAGVLAQMVLGVVAWSHRWYHPGGGIEAVVAGEALAKIILQGLSS